MEPAREIKLSDVAQAYVSGVRSGYQACGCKIEEEILDKIFDA